MVDFAIVKANKPVATPNFHFISPSVWEQSPKRQFFGRNMITIAIFRRQCFRQKIDLKIESLHLQQFSRPYLGIYGSWNFFSCLLFPFQRFFISFGPPSPTSKILYLLLCLQGKTRPNCLGRSCNPSTERPER